MRVTMEEKQEPLKCKHCFKNEFCYVSVLAYAVKVTLSVVLKISCSF
jgi:hypothetical protein